MKRDDGDRGALALMAAVLAALMLLASQPNAWATAPQEPAHQTIPMPDKGAGTGTVSPDRGGTAISQSGDIAVTVPPGAVSSDTTLYVVPRSLDVAPPSSSLLGHAFTAEAWQGLQPKPGLAFGKEIIIGIKYSDEDLDRVPNRDARRLVIQYYDEAAKEWISLPTVIDRASRKAYAQASRLAWFALSSRLPGQEPARVENVSSVTGTSPSSSAPSGGVAGRVGSGGKSGQAIVFGDVTLSEPRILLPLIIIALILVAGGAYVLLKSRGASEEPPAGGDKP